MTASDKESCFNARIVSVCIGIFMAIISGLAVIASIGGFVYIYFITSLGLSFDGSSRPKEYSSILSTHEIAIILSINGFLTFILISSLLEFAFSVVLIHGALKRKTGHLMSYFIYGNVKTALILFWSIASFVIIAFQTSLALICCGINIIFTVVVHKAYVKIKRSTEEYSKFNNDIPVNIEK